MARVTEDWNPRSRGIDERSTTEILRLINSEDEGVADVVAGQINGIGEAVEMIVEAIRHDHRIVFIGAGTSGRFGVMEAAEMSPTFGVPEGIFGAILAGGPGAFQRSVEGAEDSSDEGIAAVRDHGFGRGDVAVALSASGETPFVLGAVGECNRKGVKTVALTCNPDSRLASMVDIAVVLDVGPEIVAGSSRMKEGTAQKMALNMLTTSSMIRLGRVYDGYMVGVQASNQKLRRRASRIVSEITGASTEAAEEALREADGDARVAVLIIKLGVSAVEARSTLERAGGSLGRALRSPEGGT